MSLLLFKSTRAFVGFRTANLVPLHQRLFSGVCVHRDGTDKCDTRDRTLKWVRRVVIGLNLCPFAKRPLRDRQLYVRVAEEQDENTLLSILRTEMEKRLRDPGTTLVILPNVHPDDFQAFWRFVQIVEGDIIQAKEWQGILQVAPFHPQFVFQGNSDSDADNYTNRSPYPIIHILREDDVTNAVAALPDGDAGVVWSRNVDLLQTLWNELEPKEFQIILNAQTRNPTLRERLRDILRRYPGTYNGSGEIDR